MTLLALAGASGARAGCVPNPGQYLLALGIGPNCNASGAFEPMTPIPDAGDKIVALFANGGGTIAAPDGVSVTMNLPNSIGVYASGASLSGAPSTITIAGASIIANNSSSIGVQADAGGSVTLSGGSVTLEPTATDAAGLFATDSGSKISANGTVVVTNGPDAFGALSESGAAVNLVGGSVTTKGAGSAGVAALFGSISATGTAITTEGGVDLAGVESAGVSIGGVGATGALTNDTIRTSGAESDGVLVQARGEATLSGVNGVTTTGDRSIGLQAVGGSVIDVLGQTTISTGSTSASTGLNAHGVNADGAGSQINLSGATI